MSPRHVDLLVAGGGPAGLVTALHAARAGLEVEVWEPRSGAVDKACGEGLMPGALASLHELGVDPPGHAFHGIRYVGAGQHADAEFRGGTGRGIRRTTLHGALSAAANDAGARIEQRAVGALHQDEDGVRVRVNRDRGNGGDGGDGGAGVPHLDVHARHVVAADGLHSPVRRALGLDAAPARHRRFGLRRHFRTAPWSPYVEVHWGREVEAYVTPVADDVVGVAVLSSTGGASATRGSFEERVGALPSLTGLLQGAEPASDVRGAGPLRRGARQRVAGRVLLVGDAAGYVDALTGEGLALAFAQAGAAVRAIADGAPQRYEHDWTSLTRRYRWLTATLLAGTRPRLARRALVPASRMLPPLFDAAVNSLARPAR